MRYFVLAFAFLIISLDVQLQAQEDTASHWRLRLNLKASFDDFTVDRLGEIYCLIGNHEVQKLGENGKLKISESFRNYGEITHLDVTNPLAPHFFFRTQSYVLLTDNNLAEKAAYDLNQMGIEQAEVACRAAEGGIWLFDVRDFQLKYFNAQKRLERQSENLYLYFEEVPEIIGFIQQQQRIYLGVKNKGIFIFDIMGVFEKQIKRDELLSFNVHNDLIYYWTGNKMRVFNTKTFADLSLKLPKAIGERRDFKRIIFKDKKLYFLDEKTLQVYEK